MFKHVKPCAERWRAGLRQICTACFLLQSIRQVVKKLLYGIQLPQQEDCGHRRDLSVTQLFEVHSLSDQNKHSFWVPDELPLIATGFAVRSPGTLSLGHAPRHESIHLLGLQLVDDLAQGVQIDPHLASRRNSPVIPIPSRHTFASISSFAGDGVDAAAHAQCRGIPIMFVPGFPRVIREVSVKPVDQTRAKDRDGKLVHVVVFLPG
ncbi:hypothetical protein DFH07DRAFT_941092 [Mycena maculata]|uniref:Uncharacterized protein n=1 Tax=Mycena maculata TaxID=230809 RepID=A0AAD7J1V4_9AGAR|nr:hypothetical protein DFH07DRAFT_941092 [Mycena maculata]